MTMGERTEAGSTLTLVSDGSRVRVEWFPAATSAGEGPGVLMLHGADGLRFGSRYREGARALASAGVSVGLLHYLDATGASRVSFSTLGRDFGRWAQAVVDGLGWLGQRHEVTAGRLGVVGISLGATLALHVAGDDERVRAVVDYFGPVPQHIEHARRLPPTLILHGEDDPIVSVDNARTLSALLKKRGVRYERVIYRGQGHGFHGAVDEDAGQRCLVFLNRHLAAGEAAVR